MKANQFNPSAEEVEQIKLQNQLLPELERTCYKCGHKPCPDCGTWCDTMLYDATSQGNWGEVDKEEFDDEGKVWPPYACCDGECSYL